MTTKWERVLEELCKDFSPEFQEVLQEQLNAQRNTVLAISKVMSDKDAAKHLNHLNKIYLPCYTRWLICVQHGTMTDTFEEYYPKAVRVVYEAEQLSA